MKRKLPQQQVNSNTWTPTKQDTGFFAFNSLEGYKYNYLQDSFFEDV